MIVPVQVYFYNFPCLPSLSKCQSMPSRELDINEMLDWDWDDDRGVSRLVTSTCVFCTSVTLTLTPQTARTIPTEPARKTLTVVAWLREKVEMAVTGNVQSITTQGVGSKASVFLQGESSSSAQLRLLCGGLWGGQWGLQTKQFSWPQTWYFLERKFTYFQKLGFATKNVNQN